MTGLARLAVALLVLLYAASALPGEPGTAELDRSMVMRAAHSLVRVEARGENRRLALGTGVVIAPNMVETACHVVRNAASVVIVHAGQSWTVAAQHVDPAHDLCVFLVPYLEAVPARLRNPGTLEVGERVMAVGYSGGFGLQWQPGTVVRLHPYDGASIIQSSAAFTSGASGGPLLDGEGRVVGFLSFRMRGHGPQFFSLPVEWAQAELLESADFLPIETRFQAGPFWASDATAAPFFIQANSLEAEGRDDDLRNLCRRWRLAEPQSAEPAFVEASLEEKEGRLEAALAALNEALSQDPSHGLARRARVRLRMAAQDLAGAREDYHVLARLHPELAREAADESPVLSRE